MPFKLLNLTIDRVDFVDKGANPGAHITLIKRDNREGDGMSDQDKDTVSKAELEARLTELDSKTLDEESKGFIQKLRKLFGKVEVEEQEPTVDEKLTGVEKALMSELEKRDAEIAKLRDERERDQMIAKARSVPALGKADDTAADLLAIKKALGDEKFQKFFGRLAALNEQVNQAGLFNELGGGEDTVASPEAKLEKMAEAYASEAKTDFAKAYAHVIKTAEGRKLYKQITAATPRGEG